MNFKGTLFLFVYILFFAVSSVYQANLSQVITPLVFIFLATLSTMLVFCVGCYLSDRFILLYKAKCYKKEIILLNCANFLSWFFYLFSLKYSEPALTIIMGNAIGPILIVFFSKYIRPGRKIYQIEKISAVGIFLSLIFIVWFCLMGESGLRILNTKEIWFGSISAVLMGIGQVLFSIMSKKLSEASFKPREILALRHIFIVIFTAFLLHRTDFSWFLTDSDILFKMSLICIAMILGMYAFQKAVKLLEPIFISILILIEPIAVFMFQIFDPRLKISYFSYLGVAVIIFFSVLSITGRYYSEKART